MGTVASLVIPGADRALFEQIERVFADHDARFSLYRADSEISRIARGELVLSRSSEPLRAAYTEAIGWRTSTAGAFDPYRPDGVLDLSGVVKALAIHAARSAVVGAGLDDALLSVGGDGVALGRRRSRADSGRTPADSAAYAPWMAGIVDPENREHLLGAVPLHPGRAAIATSGTAERGEHVWRRSDPSSRTEAPYRQVTVRAADIVTADVLATAILSGGAETLSDACSQWNIDVLTVDASNGLTATPGFRRELTVGARLSA
ncbi:FAD:protein FMN transferase [Glaciibacter flavus]|uniref:FAD:protein FMN transferase n=2 Tax=Orlajensenia flava TaxID=2565934 RepID=A0A4S4FMC8_9MICO|nr:FAD:protein FMN transferase [Glaciibacter flavus]